MQSAEQNVEQFPWRFRPGQSGNPAGQSKAIRLSRRDALVDKWTAAIGGPSKLTAAELDLLRRAAELSMVRARTAEDAVRVANSISKIMAQCGLVGGGRKARAPIDELDMGEWLKHRHGAP